ncbi:hypothetical protein BDR22DRAFT_238799 [Usnea florida]
MCMRGVLNKEIVAPENSGVFISCEISAVVDIPNHYSMIQTSKPDVRLPKWSPFNAPEPDKGLPANYIRVSWANPMRDDGYM